MSIKRFAISFVKYGLLAVALLVTAGLSALTTMRVVLRTQEVVVPSLVGKPVPEAGALAARRRLVLRVEGRRNDPRVGRDLIVEQEPPAGSALKTQRSIRVWVSLGPRRINVPAVEGESVRSGRLLLDQAQVPVGRVIEVDDGAEQGTILQQHPPPGETGTLEAEGAALLVSRGPRDRDFLMPDLIGRPASAVLEALQAAGLKVAEVRYRTYPGVAAGFVLRQAPLSGHRVGAQTSISLDVSQAAP
ncbi:MAG TPA: PASTA domain-containing protein [Vicinamibacteria bacterium]|nr:PASTA domain-containing protein [Vicinamibacteria bacterium]